MSAAPIKTPTGLYPGELAAWREPQPSDIGRVVAVRWRLGWGLAWEYAEHIVGFDSESGKFDVQCLGGHVSSTLPCNVQVFG